MCEMKNMYVYRKSQKKRTTSKAIFIMGEAQSIVCSTTYTQKEKKNEEKKQYRNRKKKERTKRLRLFIGLVLHDPHFLCCSSLFGRVLFAMKRQIC